jgi:hypothetical protein
MEEHVGLRSLATLHYWGHVSNSCDYPYAVSYLVAKGARIQYLQDKPPRHPQHRLAHNQYDGPHLRRRDLWGADHHSRFCPGLDAALSSLHIPSRHHQDQQMESVWGYESTP